MEINRKRRDSYIIIIFSLILVFLFAVYYIQNSFREPPAYPSVCRGYLSTLNSAFVQYLEDHGKKFPSEWKGNEYSWIEALLPYFIGKQEMQTILYSPLDKRQPLPPSSFKFNTALAGKILKSIKNPDKVILLYEDEPRIKFYEDKHHFKFKAAYLFLDGHVEFK